MNDRPFVASGKAALNVGLWVFLDAAVSRTNVRSQSLPPRKLPVCVRRCAEVPGTATQRAVIRTREGS
jgi:hypothetical protein